MDKFLGRWPSLFPFSARTTAMLPRIALSDAVLETVWSRDLSSSPTCRVNLHTQSKHARIGMYVECFNLSPGDTFGPCAGDT